jgi:NADPH-dependent F420 reductase
MSTVSILGSGNMGTAIAEIMTRAGQNVEMLTSADVESPITGEVVILAVPYAALDDIVVQRSTQLAGKVVVDITNPVDFDTFDGLTVPADGSAAAELAAALPNSRVLKAFNTNLSATLSSGAVGERPTTVLIAGDDTAAKARLAELVTSGGLRALDAGSLRRARELEALGFLQITLAAAEKISWAGGFAVAS